MAGLEKLIEAASTPGAEQVGRIVEVSGKVSGGTGLALYSVEAAGISWTITEYAALVSIIGGLVWAMRNLFGMWLDWVKHRDST